MSTKLHSFILNCWYVTAWSSDLTDKPLSVKVGNDLIVLYRQSNGEAVALEDRCPHRMAALSLGRVEGDAIRCMYHGAIFGSDGRCLTIPGQSAVPTNFAAKRYAVIERDGWIWVWLGHANAADPSLIPASELMEAKWRRQTSSLDYLANYELLNDNLCDFSHVSFVHEKTFGMVGGNQWAESKPTITQIDRGLRIDRWIENCSNLPFLDPSIERIDLWSSYQYLLPGVLLMHGGVFPAGSAAQSGNKAPIGLEPLHATYNAQAVTPTGNQTCRYFYGVGVRSIEPEALLNPVFQLTAAAFIEDKKMIEAQQLRINMNPNTPLRSSTHDQAVNQMRRLVRDSLES